MAIGAGQTARIDVREVVGPASVGALGGLTLSLPGNESLSATQIVFDEVTGLAAIMKLFDREPDDHPKNHMLLAPMMALSQPDQALAFPSGTTLIPKIFLRNAGAGQAQISLTVDWRSESKSGEFVQPSLALLPGEMRVINLVDEQKFGQIPAESTWGTVKLSYTGRRADLVAVALSYDKENRYGLQTPFSESVSRMWAGGMWHVDSTHNTLITTGNASPESTAAEATLFYNDGKSKYRLEKTLSPGQQLWLDVGHLIRDQIPDSDGHTMPPDTMAGSYELRDLDHATVGFLYEGKLIIDKTYGHAAYGCGTCCGLTVAELIPDPFDGPEGIDYTEVMQSTEQCGGQIVDLADDAYDWHSSNTAVATLPTKVLHTVAIGSATGSGEVTVQNTHPAPLCPQVTYGPTQPVAVSCAVPTNWKQTSCSDDGGGDLHFEYTWTSSSGKLADLSSCTIGEIVTYPGGGQTYVWPVPFPATTSTNPTAINLASATTGSAADDHSLTSTEFRTPFSAASFTATQYYRYACICNGNSWVNLAGPNSIVRSTTKNSNGSYTFTVTKSACTATINPIQ